MRARTVRRRRVILPILLATPVVAGILYLTAPDHSATTTTSSDGGMPRDPGLMTARPGGATTEAGGALPYGVTVFDDGFGGVANLDPALLQALRAAATAANDAGVEFHITSGWRSPEYQDQLLRDAVAQYGSEQEAARWVAKPETSPHVSGDAADIGPSDATAWLSVATTTRAAPEQTSSVSLWTAAWT